MKKNKLKYARKAFTLIALGFLLFQGCKNNPMVPAQNTPGRRDYTWTVDTVHVPLAYIQKMWGSSPTDVWGISPGTSDSAIFHYDGVKWTCDGISRPFSPSTIFGFAKNNIWIGDIQGLIWHYDGSSWSQFTKLNYSSEKRITWENIWGESPNDVYAVGAYLDENNLFNNGVIAHFDGSKWSLLNNIKKNTTSTRIYKSITDGKYYLNGYRWNPLGDSSYLFQFDGNNLKSLYSGNFGREQYGTMGLVGNEILFVKGRWISTYDGANFHNLTYISEPNFDNGVDGKSKSDLILWMLDGIAHYNGTDVQYIYRITSNMRLLYPVIFDSVIMFSTMDMNTGNTLIIKGTLN
jgi:hypothetical protein